MIKEIERRYTNTLIISALVGVAVGVFGVLFTWTWHGLEQVVWQSSTRPIDRIWISTLAGLAIGGLLTLMFDPGNMATLVYHFHKSGCLPKRDNLPIQPVSLIGLVAGQSAGPEGALTQAGGSIGTWAADLLKNNAIKRVLTLAGMGAGFGAFLGAPVGGALLWLEMLHTRGLEYYEAIMPTIVASCAAYLVMLVSIGHGVVQPWHVNETMPLAWWAPVLALGLGVACGPIAKVYALMFRMVGKLMQRKRLPLMAQCTLAGLIIGLLGYLVPMSYFYGSAQMTDLMRIEMTAGGLALLMVVKILAASVTIHGHWQGGLIIPHMFMGAVIGQIFALWIPGMNPVLAMLCCMAGFNAAATQTPLASALIVLALTGYGAPVPIFLASISGFLSGRGVVLIQNKQSRSEPHEFHLEPTDPQIVP